MPSNRSRTAGFTSRRQRSIYELGGRPAEYGAGLKLAIECGWFDLHESGTFLRLTQASKDYFA
jgi:hypothetical protein